MWSRTADYTVDHPLSDEESNVDRSFDDSLDPVLPLEPGVVVRFECRDAVDGQLDFELTVSGRRYSTPRASTCGRS